MFFYPILGIVLVELFVAAAAPAENDPRCAISVAVTGGCPSPKWQFNQKSRECESTCTDGAPFNNHNGCAGYCRSKAVCLAPRPVPSCVGQTVTVYFWDVKSGSCKRDDTACNYYGNNFPTEEECLKTCGQS
uniref:BPTI/Kunitz inhibitor domain-containing protein n=1 Tax=Amblyomma maculatum TaxID=34609 RepID=G3MTQ4_AMBMU